MSDEDIMAGFWQMRTNVQSMSELPHVRFGWISARKAKFGSLKFTVRYVDGPAFMAVVVKSRKPHSTVICITCPHELLGAAGSTFAEKTDLLVVSLFALGLCWLCGSRHLA